jgi:ketosteroid isomerase-like protein
VSSQGPRLRIALLAALVLPAACASAGTPRGGGRERSLVDAELSFAAAAAREGVRSAFLRFADDSAVIFRPDPVPARDWWSARPEASFHLAWRPVFARVSAAGDLGFTSGPFEVADSAGQVQGYGNYVTVWRRGADGWRYLTDLGTSNPRPDPAPRAWTPEPSRPLAATAGDASAAGLLAADRDFSRRAQSAGFAAALADMGDPGMRLLRPRAFPAIGLAAARASAAADSMRSYEASPLRAAVARSGDLGWSYGEYRRLHPGAGRRESGHYVRIWAREGSGPWRVLLDVVSPRAGERDE